VALRPFSRGLHFHFHFQIKEILDQVEAEKAVQAAKATRTSLNLQKTGN
jgi:hypothetical protein